MNYTEIYKEIKSNMSILNALSKELEEKQRVLGLNAASIEEVKNELIKVLEKKEGLKTSYIMELVKEAEALKENLQAKTLFIKGKNNKHKGLCFKFMGNERNLLSAEFSLPNVIDMQEGIEELFEKYLDNGMVVFDKENIAKLLEIKKLYETSPSVVENKMINIVVDKNIKRLKNNKQELEEWIELKQKEVDSINEKLVTIVEDNLLNRLFNRKALERQERRASLLTEINGHKEKLAAINAELQDKATIRANATSYVKNDIEALLKVINFVYSFDGASVKLADYTKAYIVTTENKIKSQEEKQAKLKSRINEIQALIRLNKKANNDILEFAFTDKTFVDEMNAMVLVDANDEDAQATKFIKGKYDEYIRGCVKALVD